MAGARFFNRWQLGNRLIKAFYNLAMDWKVAAWIQLGVILSCYSLLQMFWQKYSTLGSVVLWASFRFWRKATFNLTFLIFRPTLFLNCFLHIACRTKATMVKSLQFVVVWHFPTLRRLRWEEVERGLGRGRSNCYIDGKCEGGGRCSGFRTFEVVKFLILIFDLINTISVLSL